MIEVKSLSRYYGNFAAVKDIDFQIQSNEVVGFLGLNGAGKTTTLKVLAGLLSPSTGEIIIDGVRQENATIASRSKIGFLPEELPLYQEMTVEEFLSFIGKMRGMKGSDLKSRLPDITEKCQIKDKLKSVIAELSLGYRKRVGIAQAIIHKPNLVILDEPISGLDPFQRVEMRELIRSLSTEATVLLSSHNLKEISETCDRILVLDDGKIIAKGSTADLIEKIDSSSPKLEATLIAEEATIEAALKDLDYIESFTRDSQADQDPVYTIQLKETKPETLTAALVEAGIGVRAIGRATEALEAIFLSLTQGGES